VHRLRANSEMSTESDASRNTDPLPRSPKLDMADGPTVALEVTTGRAGGRQGAGRGQAGGRQRLGELNCGRRVWRDL